MEISRLKDLYKTQKKLDYRKILNKNTKLNLTKN